MTPAEHAKAIEVTDAMIHAALKVQSPSLYRDALRKIGDGPRTTERIDADIKQAKAMIEAAIRSAVGAAPEGWQLVPVEPTEDMRLAMATHGVKHLEWAGDVYAAMLAAAPKP